MLGAIYKNYISGDCPNYVAVQVTGDDAKVNGKRLIEAYARAKTLTPNGAALSATNRACVILPPGKYDLDHGTAGACVPLTLDTEFVDIIGLTTDRSLQHIYGTPAATNSGVIVQTADDVHISNLTVEILTVVEQANFGNTDSAAYFPSTNLSNTVIDNCEFIGGDFGEDALFAMRMAIEYSGTFNYCTGGEGTFGGYGGTASGTFTNCTGGNNAFGCGGIASGTFNYCTGGAGAFGGGGTASGTFNYCTGGADAFGGAGGTASGTFNYCTGGDLDVNGKSIDWGAVISTNTTYKGDTLSVTVDTNSVGFACLLAQGADFHFDEADASSTTTTNMLVMALETGIGTKKVLTRGQICNTSWNWSSGPIYASETLGLLTQTPPINEDAVVVVAGWALSADTMFFSPYDAWITVV